MQSRPFIFDFANTKKNSFLTGGVSIRGASDYFNRYFYKSVQAQAQLNVVPCPLWNSAQRPLLSAIYDACRHFPVLVFRPFNES